MIKCMFYHDYYNIISEIFVDTVKWINEWISERVKQSIIGTKGKVRYLDRDTGSSLNTKVSKYPKYHTE